MKPVAATARAALAAEFVRAMPDVSRQLASAPSTERLWETAPELLCQAGGFDRISVYLLRQGHLWCQSLYFIEQPRWAGRILQSWRAANPRVADFPFDAWLMEKKETGIVKPRRPFPHAYKGIIESSKTREYISAPILVAGRVAGFIGLDTYFCARPLAQDDVERGTAVAALLSGALTQRALAGALRRIHTASDSLLGGLSDTYLNEIPESARQLSEREHEVVELVAHGLTNSQIAEALGISPTTVKTHVSRLLRKLGARSRAELIATTRPQD